MGETDITEGEIKYRGKILYADADESTFVIGDTLRENILMGEDYIHKRYKKVLDVVGLDITKFRGEDYIQVLENGLNFSSSERRKIILARMLYVAGDIYIMKDFFGYGESAADEMMYRRVVEGYLWDKTVIIVSNSKPVAKMMNNIMVFKNQTVSRYSTYLEFTTGEGPPGLAMFDETEIPAENKIASLFNK